MIDDYGKLVEAEDKADKALKHILILPVLKMLTSYRDMSHLNDTYMINGLGSGATDVLVKVMMS